MSFAGVHSGGGITVNLSSLPDGFSRTPNRVVVGRVPDEPQHYVVRGQLSNLERGLATTRVAVVLGMPGAGKTHIAAAYTRQMLGAGAGFVGWVNAECADTLQNGLAEIAYRLGVADHEGDPLKCAHRLRDHLNSCNESGLLVLDNAAAVESVQPLLPTVGTTRVLITSINRAFTMLTKTIIDVGTGFTRSESVAFLTAMTGIREDPGGADRLADELGDLPLALAAAAAAVAATPGQGYDRYLQRLRKQPLQGALRFREGLSHPLRADKAILLSVEAALAPTDDPDLDKVTEWLLGLFAVLAPSGVSRILLVYPDPKLDDLVDDAIHLCVQQSLISWSTEKDALTVHRLVARVLQERALDNQVADSIISNALELLEPRLFDEPGLGGRRLEGVHLVDQIDSLTASSLSDQAIPDLQLRMLPARRWAIAQLVSSSDLPRAIGVAHRSVTAHERLLGAVHPDTLASRNDLAMAYSAGGWSLAAITGLEQNLADCERILGSEHPDTVTTRNFLSSAYKSEGRLSEATVLDRQNPTEHEATCKPHGSVTVDRTDQ